MKKFLPHTANNPKGFTLVELLVVVSIIAVLSVIGITVFANVQKGVRDGRRKADIQAIQKALEAHYNDSACGAVAATPYCPVNATTAPTLFANGSIPTNPNPGGGTYSVPTVVAATYFICATLENATGNYDVSNNPVPANTGAKFCLNNQQ